MASLTKLRRMKKKDTQDTVKKTIASLLDESVDLERRKMLLANVTMDGSEMSDCIVETLFEAASNGAAESIYNEKVQQLNALLKLLEEGPVRAGSYVGMCPEDEPTPVPRARVKLDNGDSAYPLVVNPELAGSLCVGDTMLLDAQVRAVLRKANSVEAGEVAVLKRRIDDDRVEASLHEHGEDIYLLAAGLKKAMDEGEVDTGARLVVCSRKRIAFEALSSTGATSHDRFVVTDPVPDVVIDRDIACPPAYIGELLDHIRTEMLHPELNRRYGIRPMQTRLLTGVPGSGKTLSMLALIRGTYDLVSEITGAPIELIPPLVLQMSSPKVLSHYLGVSDKNAEAFVDMAIKKADEPFVTPDGREWKLPVICRCEEIDALARARGSADTVYDRIQTTFLERIDHLSRDLGDKLIMFIFSTNLLQQCDTAFVRRGGGEIVSFGHLGRRQFAAILAKHVRGLPIRTDDGDDAQQTEQRICRDVTDWLFSPNGHDAGQLEITYAGSSTPEVKYRRDLLTGAVIDRSIQQAAKEARKAEVDGDPTPGLTTQMLASSLCEQISSICDQVNPLNAQNYLTLPDGVRVGNVRRIEQPTVQFFELDRSNT